MYCSGQNYNEYYANKRYECLRCENKPCKPYKSLPPCKPLSCSIPCDPQPCNLYIPYKPVCDILMKTTPKNISCIQECDILKNCK